MKAFPGRFSPVLVLGLALAAAARGADSAPSVDSILEKSITATGGRAAMEKVKSRVIKGDLDLMGATSEWVMQAKAPDKQCSEFNNPNSGAVADGFDGVVAWSRNPSGIRVKEGEELAKSKRDADFYRFLHLKKLYPDLAYKGADKVDGEEVSVLESKPSPSSSERFSFSVKSGQLIRQESAFEGPQGKLSVDVHMSDFRAVDGVQYAHGIKLKVSVAGQDFEFGIKVKEIKHNLPIEDSKFAKPAS